MCCMAWVRVWRALQIQRWQEAMVQRCEETKFVETVTCKRRRWLPEIDSPDDRARSAAQRCAVNTACQAAAADISKWSMLRVRDAVREHGLHGDVSLCLQVRLPLATSIRAHSQPTMCAFATTARGISQWTGRRR